MNVAIGPAAMAMPSVPTIGKAETASGPSVTVAVAGCAGRGPCRRKDDGDRRAIDRARRCSACEGDRVG